MTEFMPSAEFEEKLRQAAGNPRTRSRFCASPANQIICPGWFKGSASTFPPAPGLGNLLGLGLFLGSGSVGSRPQRVAAEMKKLFGYLPGFGIVERNAALRVLDEPVTQTREGITVTVKQAFLTLDKTVADL